MTTMHDYCPACDNRLDYEVDGHTYSRIIGVEIPGVYDGVLYWLCPDCGHRWHRFRPEDGRLYRRAVPYVEDDE